MQKTINYINVVKNTSIGVKMTTILNKSIKKIIEVFYQNKNKKMHLRELSRQVGLEGQSIVRYLKELEEKKILKYEKDGNMKKYYLNKSDEVYSILSFFDIQRQKNIPSIKKEAIKLFLTDLIEKPIICFLFGSVAKNSSKKDSDIDLLLIVNKRINIKNSKDYVNSQTAQNINEIQIEYSHFKKELLLKEDKVIQSAVETGYALTNHIEYYRCFE